jgi:hypothetical protein
VYVATRGTVGILIDPLPRDFFQDDLIAAAVVPESGAYGVFARLTIRTREDGHTFSCRLVLHGLNPDHRGRRRLDARQ